MHPFAVKNSDSCCLKKSEVFAAVPAERYAFPDIGALNIAEIETDHLAQLIKTIDDNGVYDVAGRTIFLTFFIRKSINTLALGGIR